jgi:hypothetical protein
MIIGKATELTTATVNKLLSLRQGPTYETYAKMHKNGRLLTGYNGARVFKEAKALHEKVLSMKVDSLALRPTVVPFPPVATSKALQPEPQPERRRSRSRNRRRNNQEEETKEEVLPSPPFGRK